MTSIFDEIEKKKQKDIDAAVQARGQKIMEMRDAIVDLLRINDCSVGDSQMALKAALEKLTIAMMEKKMSDIA